MPGFTTKPSTDPGPFDALRPASERALERATPPLSSRSLRDGLDPGSGTTLGGRGELEQGQTQQSTHLASSGTDEDGELDHLYRFREIPVTAEMRRELLGAKLPLASIEQLADTHPPHKSSLSAPSGTPPMGGSFVDRHAPTEPVLPNPRQQAHDPEPLKHERQLERQLLDGDSYSTTAPTLLSVRRRRLRNQRYVIGVLAALSVAVLIGVAWRRYTRPPAPLARVPVEESAKKAHSAGNRPGGPAPPRTLAPPTTESIGAAVRTPGSPEPHSPHSPDAENSELSQSAQLGSPAVDATSSSPLPADSRSASREPQPGSASPPQAPAVAQALSGESRASSPSTQSNHATSKVPAATPNKVSDKASDNASNKAPPSSTIEPGKSKAFDPEELIF